jgi:hypothetical protein
MTHYYLWMCCRARLAVSYQRWVYNKPASIKEQHENKKTERLMIENVPELQEVARREVVVGVVGMWHLNSLLLRHLLYMLQCNELVLKVLLGAR